MNRHTTVALLTTLKKQWRSSGIALEFSPGRELWPDSEGLGFSVQGSWNEDSRCMILSVFLQKSIQGTRDTTHHTVFWKSKVTSSDVCIIHDRFTFISCLPGCRTALMLEVGSKHVMSDRVWEVWVHACSTLARCCCRCCNETYQENRTWRSFFSRAIEFICFIG